MRIVFIGPFAMQPKRTMAVRALPLAQALAARGHQVLVVLPPWDSPQDSGRQWAQGGVQVCNVRLPPRLPLGLLATTAIPLPSLPQAKSLALRGKQATAECLCIHIQVAPTGNV